jgi:hypothetical protein
MKTLRIYDSVGTTLANLIIVNWADLVEIFLHEYSKIEICYPKYSKLTETLVVFSAGMFQLSATVGEIRLVNLKLCPHMVDGRRTMMFDRRGESMLSRQYGRFQSTSIE